MSNVQLLIDQTCQRCGRKTQLAGVGYAEPWSGMRLCPTCIEELGKSVDDWWPTVRVGPSEVKVTFTEVVR